MMFLVVRPCGSSSARIHHHHPTPPRSSRNVVVRCSVSSSVQEKEEKGTELDCSVSFPPIRAAKRVVLVRHGQSTWNAEGRIQGSSNFSVLTKKGESQAETSRQMLINDHFDACFARFLLLLLHLALLIGSYKGLLKHEGKERFGSAFCQWQVDAANFNIDGHYPVRELWDRARSCWTKILAHDSRSVLVVAHNAVNQALVATAIGLGPEYFRTLLQSNCGVSVLDFIPRSEGGSPHICLNRLNQTPGSPIAGGKSGGREPSKRIILICNGSTQGNTEDVFPFGGDQPLNMLGVIQSQKSAELLLDLKVNSIISSLNKACIGTATIISQVQEAADCLGADCVPRYVEMKQMGSFDVETIFKQTETASNAISNFPPFQPGWLNRVDDGLRTKLWDQSRKAWQSLLDEISDESNPEVVVAVGHPAIHIALMGHCLNLTKEWLGSFHLDAGSVSLVDFPDGPKGKGVIRCLNYTAHLGRWSIPITRSTEDGEEF
ncbi:hypothetical protein JHK87_031166 [Glycine soja]|nr:hypothetical protein JHK87_031166 [Glycine soja]